MKKERLMKRIGTWILLLVFMITTLFANGSYFNNGFALDVELEENEGIESGVDVNIPEEAEMEKVEIDTDITEVEQDDIESDEVVGNEIDGDITEEGEKGLEEIEDSEIEEDVNEVVGEDNNEYIVNNNEVYEKNFKDAKIGNWNFYVGKANLVVEDEALKVTRDATVQNNAIMIDNDSPVVLNSEAEVEFSLNNGNSRFGIVLRASDDNSYLFVGYDNEGNWLIQTAIKWQTWLNNISGPALEEGQRYKMKARVVGNTVSIWLDGEKIFDEEVSLNGFPQTAGRVGFRTWFDNKTVDIYSYRYGKVGSLEEPVVPEEPIEKAIKSIEDTIVTTFVDSAPIMPDYVNVVYEDNTKGVAKVTWEDIDSSNYSEIGEFEVHGTVEGTDLEARAIVKVTEAEFIESDKLRVIIDKEFPSILRYEYKENDSIMYGQEEKIEKILINKKEYTPEVDFEKVADDKVEYTLNIKELEVEIDISLEIIDNIVHFSITEIRENGDNEVNTIEIPNHNVLSVRSNQDGAAFAGTRLHTAVSGTGDEFINLTENIDIDSSDKGYMYAILNTANLSGSLWTNAVDLKPTDGDNTRIRKRSTEGDGYVNTGIWSGEWTYRAEGMYQEEPLPEFKVIITDDLNNDGIVDWQDGAIAFRDIMNNPFGSERIPELVVQRIPFNFASQATNPFLKTLDETKRVYLATDGLGQNVLLKGYGSEGHDSAHPDYGLVGKRQGGVEDLNTLLEEGKKYNAYFGVHINAREAYPEAKAFNEELVNKNSLGWDWLDPSYTINIGYDAKSGNRLQRLKELKEVAPGLEFIYLDVWYWNGWDGRNIAREINSQGWRLETEFPNVLEYDSTWTHWAVDYAYGGESLKGFNSDIVRFIRNHQKDTWIAKHPLLGGAEMADYEGWQRRANFDNLIEMTFKVGLPTKYIQHFPIMKWEDDTITLENDVVITNKTGQRVITKDSKEILRGDAYLLPWNPKEETKLYHFNLEGGTTTWELPNSFNDVSLVKLYELTDLGRVFVEDLTVENGSITIDARAGVPYVVVKDGDNSVRNVEFGEKAHIKDPGFNTGSLDNWNVTGENVEVVRNDRGQYELKVFEGKGAKVEQKITDLKPGNYSASVKVAVDGNRKASIKIKDSNGNEYTNYTESSIAKNYIGADVKHGTFMQTMRVKFTVPEDGEKYTLALEVSPGVSEVTFDDVRIMEIDDIPSKDGAVFFEDFENIDMGVYPFVKGPAGGANDPRTHLSELHVPYTQKGWNGKLIDDVIEGNYSLKMHKEHKGKLLQTIPQNFKFESGKFYRVSFDYQMEFDDDYNFIIGDGFDTIYQEPLEAASETVRFVKDIAASNSNETWVGFESVSSKGDLVIDNFMVEEIDSVDIGKTKINPVDLAAIPNDNITATASSQEPCDAAENAIDDNPGTMWHTKWDGSDKLPQHITLDLGKEYEINKVTVLPRQSGPNGLIEKYELHISNDGENFEKVAEGTFDYPDRKAKEINFDKTTARYVKLVALKGYNGFASVAEFKVFRDPVTIESGEDIEIKTLVGQPPVLPKKVKTLLSDGSYTDLPVSWDEINSSNFSKIGTFTVEGDINNSGIKVNAEVNVVGVTEVETIEIKGYVGEKLELPTRVKVTYSDGSSDDRNVYWGEYGYIDPEIFNIPGEKIIEGNIEGIGEKALVKIILEEKPEKPEEPEEPIEKPEKPVEKPEPTEPVEKPEVKDGTIVIEDIKIDGDKAIVNIDEAVIDSELEKMKLSGKLVLEVPKTEKNEIKVIIPSAVFDKAAKKEANKLRIYTEIVALDLKSNNFDVTGNQMILVINKKGQEVGINVLDEDGNVLDINNALKMELPYGENVRNKNNITAILIKEDGTREAMGGIYDASTKTIKFLTNRLGKFTVEERTREFKDIGSYKWAEAAIESMAVKGIINGRTEEQFVPSDNITRAEFAALISRMLKYNENIDGGIPFKDVSLDKWYYSSIVAVYRNGLMEGKAEDVFDPEGHITREEMAKIIGSILEDNFYKKQEIKELDKFLDKDQIASWAQDGATMAVENEIIVGDNGKFMPKEKATRAEAAVMLYRLYELVIMD